jgi:type I restriction enzyme, S subunit
MSFEGGTFTVAELIEEGFLSIGDGYRAKNEELSTSGIPFARAGNIDNGFNFVGADCFPVEDLDKVGEKLSRPGDVVFTSKGTVGRFAFVLPSTPRFVFSPQLSYWRSLNQDVIDSRFLYCWMLSREFQKQIDSVKGQTDMADYVSLRDQRDMTIDLPSISQQRAIVRVLGPLNDRIDLNLRTNVNLAALRDTLLRKLLSGELRVNGEKKFVAGPQAENA